MPLTTRCAVLFGALLVSLSAAASAGVHRPGPALSARANLGREPVAPPRAAPQPPRRAENAAPPNLPDVLTNPLKRKRMAMPAMPPLPPASLDYAF